MPSPKLRIRQTDDLDQIQELDTPLLGGLDDLLNRCTWWLAEALIEGVWTPVGYAGLEITDGGKYAFLSRAGVVPLARGQGIQRKLIRVRERYARAHGCTHCYTYVVWYNTASMTSLVRAGYHPYTWEREGDGRFIHLHKKLDTKRRARARSLHHDVLELGSRTEQGLRITEGERAQALREGSQAPSGEGGLDVDAQAA